MKRFICIISIIIIISITIFTINKLFANKNTTKYTVEMTEKLYMLNNIHEKLDFFDFKKVNDYLLYKKEHPAISDERIIIDVNIGLHKPFYIDTKHSNLNDDILILVNKYNYLGNYYIPEDLETIESSYASGNRQLRHSARIAFETLAMAAKKEGYDIYVVSAYRSYEYQKTLYENYRVKDGNNTDKYSARPGHSEHQTGLAIDVADKTQSYSYFGNTTEFIWMKANAYKYGFIERYTAEYENITGYIAEPWHYRYVGIEASTYIHNNPMVYEEYHVKQISK